MALFQLFLAYAAMFQLQLHFHLQFLFEKIGKSIFKNQRSKFSNEHSHQIIFKPIYQKFRVVVAVPIEHLARIANICPVFSSKSHRHCVAIGVRNFQRSIGSRHAISAPPNAQHRQSMLQFLRILSIQHTADKTPSFQWIFLITYHILHFCLPFETKFMVWFPLTFPMHVFAYVNEFWDRQKSTHLHRFVYQLWFVSWTCVCRCHKL